MKMLKFKTTINSEVRTSPENIIHIKISGEYLEVKYGFKERPDIRYTKLIEQDKEDYKEILEKRYGN